MDAGCFYVAGAAFGAPQSHFAWRMQPLGASQAHFAWQVQHLADLSVILRRSEHLSVILRTSGEVRGSPATYGRWLLLRGRPSTWNTSVSFCVVGAALEASHSHFAWQVQHLADLSVILRGKCSTWRTLVSFFVAGAALGAPSTQHHLHYIIRHTIINTTPSPQHHQNNLINTTSSTHHHLHNTIYTIPCTQHHPHNTIYIHLHYIINHTIINHTIINTTPSPQHHQHHLKNTTSSTHHHLHNNIYTTSSTHHHLHNTAPSTLHHQTHHHQHNLIHAYPHITIYTTPSTLHHKTHHHQHNLIHTSPSTQHHPRNTIHATPSTQHHLHHIIKHWRVQLGALPFYPFCLIPADPPLLFFFVADCSLSCFVDLFHSWMSKDIVNMWGYPVLLILRSSFDFLISKPEIS